jgi:hypothetical protein
MVQDVCPFAAENLPPGAEFTFSVGGAFSDLPCVVCDVLPAGLPSAENSVTNIKLISN